MRKIFVCFDDEFLPHRDALIGAPDIKRHFTFEPHRSIEDFAALDSGAYAALCLYVNIPSIGDGPYRKLLAFVRRGGGLMAFHATSNAFRNQPSFFEVLGARFVRHGKIGRYAVNPAEAEDPLAAGAGEFEVEDELFRQRYRSGIRIHCVYRGPRIVEPVVWSNRYGKGAVVGISPGHRVETMKNENIRKIIGNGLRMIVNPPPPSSPGISRKPSIR
jgi:type 1 glutamine amidotransferase